jgi:hypothetical protein
MSAPRSAAVGTGDITALSHIESNDAVDHDIFARLGADYPAWPIDAIVLSSRARTLLIGMARMLLPVIGYWDQRLRALSLHAGEIVLDAAGSYARVR